MVSVGLDRQIVFYDISEKIIVKRILAPFPLSCVHFASDGHTIAVGSSMNGQNQQLLIYDLRKSSSITLGLQGHESAIQSVRFTNKVSDRKSNNTFSAVSEQKPGQEMKTIE
jgi:WD40 repeat protein